jgi:CheY-like chemotaxis protein
MSKRILVVEDQPDNRQIIRDMLAGIDCEITEAENGEQAHCCSWVIMSGDDFAAWLDRAIARSDRAKVIEHRRNEHCE